jgi:CPA1 family monovalent cation:H+ antiporter
MGSLKTFEVTGALIATRVAWVFPLWAVSQWRRGKHRPSWPVPAVVSWAGTRGVVPLAAALSIPLTTASGAALPQRDLVLVLAAAAIVISLIVQGFTLEPLVRLAGFGPATAVGPLHEETIARLHMAEAGLARLDELADSGAAPDAVIDRLRSGLQARIGNTRAPINRPQKPKRESCPSESSGAISSLRRTPNYPCFRSWHDQCGHPPAAAAEPGPGNCQVHRRAAVSAEAPVRHCRRPDSQPLPQG